MSGGSWDYLYGKLDLGEFVPPAELRKIAERAREIWPHDAEVHRHLERLLHIAQQYEQHFRGVSSILHDIEWLDSGDYGEDKVEAAMKWWPQQPPRCDVCQWSGLDEGVPCSQTRWNAELKTRVPCTGTVRR